MGSCTSTVASLPDKTQQLWNSRKWCEIIASDPWWDYPTIYKSRDEQVWSSEGLEQGNYFTLSGLTLEIFIQGRRDDIARLNEAIALLAKLNSDLNTPDQGTNPAVKVSPAKISEMLGKAKTAKQDLEDVLSSKSLDAEYGGRTAIPLVGQYFMTFGETADLKYAGSQLARAGRLLEEIYFGLTTSSCAEDPEGEECDRITAALEKLAEKDFGCEGLDKIAAAVGADDLSTGVTVPRLMTEKEGGGTVTLRSIPEFIRWQFLQFNAVIGPWPITMTAKDTEIDEAGDQTKTYTAPNISEAIASLLALSVTNDTALDATLKGTMAAAGESALTRQLLTKCHAILNNLQDWASYTVEEEVKEVPFAVDVTAKTIDQALRATKKQVIVTNFRDDPKDDDFDIERIGRIVNTIYAIVSSVFVHRLNKDAPETTIRSDLEKMQNTIDDGDEDNFSAWLERAEYGFGDAPSSYQQSQPAQTPYGRKLDRRPRIKQTEGQGNEDIQDGQDGSP